MTERILLDTSGVRISKPFISALTGKPHEMFFSSDGTMPPVFISGTISFTASENGWKRVNFGKTFPNAPLCYGVYKVGTKYRVPFFTTSRWFGDDSYFYEPMVMINVNTSYLEITNFGNGAMTVYYKVLDYY